MSDASDPQFNYPHDCRDYVFPCPMDGGHSIPGMDVDDDDPE